MLINMPESAQLHNLRIPGRALKSRLGVQSQQLSARDSFGAKPVTDFADGCRAKSELMPGPDISPLSLSVPLFFLPTTHGGRG